MILNILLTYCGTLVRTIASILINIYLSRKLSPGDFGIAAISLSIVSFGSLIADSGFGARLIQKKDVDEVDVVLAFRRQSIMVLIIFLIIILISAVPFLRSFNALFTYMPYFAVSLLFSGMSQVSTSILKRKMRFKNIQVAQLTAYFLGFALPSITIAYLGFGIWGLIFGQIFQSVIYFTLAYNFVRHPIYLKSRTTDSREKDENFRFSTDVLKTNISNWGISNLDTLIIGYVTGNIFTGLYNRSNQLSVQPVNTLIGAFQNVLFPYYSRTDSDKKSQVKKVFFSLYFTLALLAPVFLSFSTYSRLIVSFIYGDQWTGASEIFSLMCLAMPIYGMMSMIGPFLWARGSAISEFYVSLLILILTVSLYALFLPKNFSYAGYIFLFLHFTRLCGMIFMFFKISGANLRDFAKLFLVFIVILTISSYIGKYDVVFFGYNFYSLFNSILFGLIASFLIILYMYGQYVMDRIKSVSRYVIAGKLK